MRGWFPLSGRLFSSEKCSYCSELIRRTHKICGERQSHFVSIEFSFERHIVRNWRDRWNAPGSIWWHRHTFAIRKIAVHAVGTVLGWMSYAHDVCMCMFLDARFFIHSPFPSTCLCWGDGRINVRARACNRFVGLWMCVRPCVVYVERGRCSPCTPIHLRKNFPYANGNKWLISHFLLVAFLLHTALVGVLEDTGNSSQVERATDDPKCICHWKNGTRYEEQNKFANFSMKNKCDHDNAHSHLMLDAFSCSAIVDDEMRRRCSTMMMTICNENDVEMIWVVPYGHMPLQMRRTLHAFPLRSPHVLIKSLDTAHEKKNAPYPLHVWVGRLRRVPGIFSCSSLAHTGASWTHSQSTS